MKKYEKNNHIIYHGDVVNILQNEFNNASIDLIFIDPPYNIGKKFSQFKDKWSSDLEYAQ